MAALLGMIARPVAKSTPGPWLSGHPDLSDEGSCRYGEERRSRECVLQRQFSEPSEGYCAWSAGMAALIVGGADIVVIGGWTTVAAGVVGIVGGVLGTARPVPAALLMALAAVTAALVAPGVIPAIADQALLFIAYLTGGALLLVGAIMAFVSRKRLTRPQSTESIE